MAISGDDEAVTASDYGCVQVHIKIDVWDATDNVHEVMQVGDRKEKRNERQG